MRVSMKIHCGRSIIKYIDIWGYSKWNPQIGGLVRVSITIIKYYIQKDIKKERVYLNYSRISESIPEGPLDLNSYGVRYLRAKADGRSHGTLLLSALFSMACSTTFPIELYTSCKGVVSLMAGLNFLISLWFWGFFFNWDSLLSSDYCLFQVDIKLTSKMGMTELQ